MNERGRIIFLNGVTSAGKTSIVEALQERDDIFWYVVANDLFQEMIRDNPLDIVEVYCPLEICRQRNIDRGDRYEEQSEEQHSLMAENIRYSMTVDTSLQSPAECAESIIRTLF